MAVREYIARVTKTATALERARISDSAAYNAWLWARYSNDRNAAREQHVAEQWMRARERLDALVGNANAD